ncbi:Hypothetical predicted protein [Cloeon dipterum]|uniref:poly(ADP-ribose) glycohydrolase n=1 Tax=Cloeon dipterum TaxID=197152 RepID=A0A8S1CVS0_9INSE|nr:Hypothetical predicted protein [Cloeon dipterum]
MDYEQVRLSMSRTLEDSRPLNGIQIERFIRLHSISSKIKQCGRLDLLVETLDSELEHNARVQFFDKAVPRMVNVLYKINPGSMDTLLDKFRNQKRELTLSRSEIACLLANAFFCSYPDDTNMNFSELYSRSWGCGFNKEKIKCAVTYFNEVYGNGDQNMLQERVTFKRNTILTIPDLMNSTEPIIPLNVIHGGSIRKAFEMVQVNFANKIIGGDVLGSTCLREEMWFITCPELIVSRFFSREMEVNEAIIVEGVLQYVDFRDANSYFTCQGPMAKSAFRGPHTVISIDAMDFSNGINGIEQYTKPFVDRELVKAFAGFSGTTAKVIATGNWGGGCFNGDSVLKAKIQMIAASQAGKALYYFAFSKNELVKKLENDGLTGDNFFPQTVGEAYRHLLRFASQLYNEKKRCSSCNCHH